MMANMQKLILCLSLLLCWLMVCGEVAAAELTVKQDHALQAYLAKVGRKGSIPDRYIQALAPDPSPLQKKFKFPDYFVVLYTHEDPYGLGGNDYVRMLTVFVKKHGKYRPVASKQVGGASLAEVELAGPPKGFMSLKLKAKFYAQGDGACCPSVPGYEWYTLEHGKLRFQNLLIATQACANRKR